MNKYSVTIVIPAYNASKTIAATVRACLAQSIMPNQIVVVDDGSTDETAKIIKSFPQVKYVYQENAGPAVARNRGAQESDTNIIFFTDSDCVPHADWVEKSIAGFKNQSIAAVCGSYDIANPQNLWARCIHQEIKFRHNVLMPEFPRAFGSYNVAIRREIFKSLGGFNAGYRRASGEDNDLSYKIIRAGYKIVFVKDSLVAHFHTESLEKYLKEQFRHGFWRVKMYVDHPKMVRGDDYTFWKDVIEVPLSGLIILFAIGGLIEHSMVNFFVIFLATMVMIEFFYGCLMGKDVFVKILLTLMMFLRAFARTLGFSTGILSFFCRKNFK